MLLQRKLSQCVLLGHHMRSWGSLLVLGLYTCPFQLGRWPCAWTILDRQLLRASGFPQGQLFSTQLAQVLSAAKL